MGIGVTFLSILTRNDLVRKMMKRNSKITMLQRSHWPTNYTNFHEIRFKYLYIFAGFVTKEVGSAETVMDVVGKVAL